MMFRPAPLVRLAIAAALAISPATFAQAPPQQSLNVQSADIRAFIQDVSRVTGRTFVIDPRVEGTVTIASGSPLSDDQMYEVFLATLRAHGYVAIPTSSGALRIAPDEDAATQPSGPGGERFVTQVIRLKSRDAASIVPVVQPLVGRGGQVSAAQRTNAIVITDFADNVRRLTALVNDLDRDTDTIDILTLKNSRATVLVSALREITGSGSDPAKTFSAASFTAVDSSNSIVIRGPVETVARLRQVASMLDEQARPTGDTRVIFLQHVDAGQIVDLLQTVIDQSPRAPAGADAAAPSPPNPGQRGSIARFEGGNAIVIRADPTVQKEIEDIVRQLDRRSEQVLVQAIVVELSDGAAQDLGVQLLLSGKDNGDLPFFATNYSNTSPSLLALAGAAAGQNSLPADSPILQDLQDLAISSLLGSTGVLGGIASDLGGDGLFGMVLNAVKRDQGSNLLSTPSILTLNNREAYILVGQDVPVTTGEVLSANNNNPFRTTERKDVGIKLTVRPQINSDGAISLFLRQEVSSVAAPLSASVGDLVFNKREIETNVLVDNGEVVVLGGLLDEGDRISAQKVPLLGDLPLVGGLFRSDSRETFKTNLMVFIRPVILKNAADARAQTWPDVDRMLAMQQATGLNTHSSLDEIVGPEPSLSPPPPVEAPLQ